MVNTTLFKSIKSYAMVNNIIDDVHLFSTKPITYHLKKLVAKQGNLMLKYLSLTVT